MSIQKKENTDARPQISLERYVPRNHFLRKLNYILDLSFLDDKTRSFYCRANGRPPIDPKMFFRMQILGYLYGITSDRKLCDEIQVNLAYRWFLGISLSDRVPDHSSLSKIRDRLGVQTFHEVFDEILNQCQSMGLVPGKRFLVDASLVEANASINSMIERSNSDPKSRALRNYEQRYHDFKAGKKKENYQTKLMSVKLTQMLP